MGITDYLTCLLRNLYSGQEIRVRIGHGATDCFQIRKEVRQGCILSPCLFNFYAEYIMQNARLDEAQAGIKFAERNNNLRYVDDTTLMAKSKENLKSLLMRAKKESENRLETQHSKNYNHRIWSNHFMESRMGENRSNDTFYFLSLQNQSQWRLQP